MLLTKASQVSPKHNRDVSHVLRDKRGRWRDTPGADDDVVVSDEVSPLMPAIVRKPIDYVKHQDKPDLDNMEGLVSRLHEQYTLIEPGVTMGMERMAKHVGGELKDLKHRVKTLDSMISKLFKGMMRHKSSANESVDYLTDTLRYTMVLPDDKYVAGIQRAFETLKDGGYEPYMSRTFKYDGRSYKGLNAVFKGKNGHFVELQFHTPRTYEAKEESHALYSIAREMRRSDPQKWPLVQRMRQAWEGVRLPDGFGELPGRWA